MEAGLFYLILGVFGLLGFVRLFAEKRRLIVLAWIFLAPIPAVLTYEDIPSATRASFLMFPLILTAVLGFLWVFDNSKKNLRTLFVLACFLALFLETAFFAHQYFAHQKFYKGFLRDEGAKEIAKYIEKERGKYDLVVVQHGPNLPFYFLFFNGHFGDIVEIDISNKNEDFRYENVLFTRSVCPSSRATEYKALKVIFVDEPDCERKAGTKEIFKVVRADLTEAFRVMTVDK